MGRIQSNGGKMRSWSCFNCESNGLVIDLDPDTFDFKPGFEMVHHAEELESWILSEIATCPICELVGLDIYEGEEE